MQIELFKVTWYTEILTVIIFFSSLAGAFFLGMHYKAQSSIPPFVNPVNDIFGLAKKHPATKLFYSDKLGVGLTYVPNPCDFDEFLDKEGNKDRAGNKRCWLAPELTVTEQGDKIFIHDPKDNYAEHSQHIKVYNKKPEDSLEKSIEMLIKDNTEKECYVSIDYANRVESPNYSSGKVKISESVALDNYPDDVPECALPFGFGFFLMNKNVPDKFVWIVTGQDQFGTDGTVPYGAWQDSVRILD